MLSRSRQSILFIVVVIIAISMGQITAQGKQDTGYTSTQTNRNTAGNLAGLADQPLNGASGNVYYVAITGSNSNPGTAAQPFRTINYGSSKLHAGATLIVGPGTYAESLENAIPAGTSWAQPVTLLAWPRNSVILRPNSGVQRVINFQDDIHYVVVDGFVIDAINSSIDGIKFQGNPGRANVHHINIVNTEVKNAPRQGILVSDLDEYIDFNNVTVHDNGSTDFDHGIYIQGSHITVENSSFFRNAGWGIHMYGGSNNYNVARNNRLYDNARLGLRGKGIGVYTGTGALVYNNLIWGSNEAGIQVGSGANNVAIYNNTIAKNRDAGVIIESDATNVTFRNNIIYQPTGSAFTNQGAGTVIDHNLIGDPQFVNLAAGIFLLQSTSRAIDAGTTIAAITTDFNATPRPQGRGYDIGAYEFSGTRTGQGDTVGVFRPSLKTFFLRNSNTTGTANIQTTVGESTDLPVMGDWNGDGIDTAGVYRPSKALFFLQDSNANGSPILYNFALGTSGGIPMVGDWDGNGTDGVGVFQPSTGLIFLKNGLTSGYADKTMVLGVPGDVPVAGDWDGNGVDSPGIYRPSKATFFLTNQVCNCTPSVNYVATLGVAGDSPFTGDWNGNGQSGIGVFRPTNGLIYLKNSPVTGYADISMVYGVPNDKPVAGHWVSSQAQLPLTAAPVITTASPTTETPKIAPTFVP
ncbi:MAG: right-handed parallel beta-helix repeat-containing protein [Chloroflexota bacterium]